MAAKRRGRRKKTAEVTNSHELPGGFWRQIMALLMICIAIVFVVTWMGKGGEALQKVNDISLRVFGYTTYLFPVLLTYLAVMIFRAQNNRLDASVWVASALMIFWFCGVFGVPTYGQNAPTGGAIGEALNSIAVKTLGKGVAIFAYIILILITALFMYAETPAALFRKIGSIFKTGKDEEDVKNAKVMRRASGREIDPDDDGLKNFKVNSNVEIADSKKEKRSLLAKKSDNADKHPVVEEPAALMAVSDPNWEMPSMDLLNKKRSPADPGDTHNNAAIIKDTLEQFGINVEVEDIPLAIVYEDDDLLIINKESGMVVHPAPGHYTGTLVNALLYKYKNLAGDKFRPGIVHRLDKDTSGLMIVAKNEEMLEKISLMISKKEVERKYLAIVDGLIKHDTGEIDAPIGRDRNNRQKMAVTDVNSKEAITHFKVLERFNNNTYIECILDTC